MQEQAQLNLLTSSLVQDTADGISYLQCGLLFIASVRFRTLHLSLTQNSLTGWSGPCSKTQQQRTLCTYGEPSGSPRMSTLMHCR